jgi:hypothetical protein
MSELSDRYRMTLRVFVVFIGYVVYRVVAGDERLIPGIMAGVGTGLIGFRVVGRLTDRRGEPIGVTEALDAFLGLGLIVVGVLLAIR